MKKKTMQLLLRELFLIVRTHKNGKRSLVLNRSPLVTPGPTVICPIKIYGVETSIGFCVDNDSITHFYLFNTVMPHLEESSRKKKIVLELQGGKMEGFGRNRKYINKVIPILNTIPSIQTISRNGNQTQVEVNYDFILSLIFGEKGKLQATREFNTKEDISKEEFFKLSTLNDDNYKNLNILIPDQILY